MDCEKKNKIVYETSLLLVQHFKQCMEDERGVHSRIFNYILHPENNYVLVGESQAVKDGAKIHPEHVVPCVVLIEEVHNMIRRKISDNEIAKFLSLHWKIVNISKEEASKLDSKNGLNLKSSMPDEWSFESGNTYARLKKANIKYTLYNDPI